MTDFGILFCRLFFGLMMLSAHGWPKLSMDPTMFPDPLGISVMLSYWLVVFAEVICSGAVAIGLFSRLASIPVIITMLVASFVVHAEDPFSKKEFALLYAAGFIIVFLTGSGKYSVQEVLGLSSHKKLFRFFLK